MRVRGPVEKQDQTLKRLKRRSCKKAVKHWQSRRVEMTPKEMKKRDARFRFQLPLLAWVPVES